MPGKTKTFVVTDVSDVAVVAQIYTAQITVQEDPSVANWPTIDFTVKKPSSSDVAIRRPIGGTYVFTKGQFYAPGETAGYVRLPSTGSTTFQQDDQ